MRRALLLAISITVLGTVLGTSFAACVDDTKTCKKTSDCVTTLLEMCLPSPKSSNMWCAYPTTECPSGYHWGLHAGDDLSPYCVAGTVPDAGVTVDSGP